MKTAKTKIGGDNGFSLKAKSATVKVELEPKKKFTLALRRPAWAGDGFAVLVNGKTASDLPPPGSYVELKRTWKTGDTVSLVLPKALHEEPLPDNPRRVALMWGPLVLAGDLGPEERRRGNQSARAETAPVFVVDDRPVSSWLKPVAGKPGSFHSDGVGREPMTLILSRSTGCTGAPMPRIGICSRRINGRKKRRPWPLKQRSNTSSNWRLWGTPSRAKCNRSGITTSKARIPSRIA